MPRPVLDPMLDVRSLRLSFGSTVALRAVDLTVSSGEVVALLGANGAGKSTLIKVLAGVVAPQGGAITIDGRRFSHGLTAAAGRAHGLAFVHQDLGLVGPLTVSENIALVAGYRRRGGLIDWRGQSTLARQTLDRLGVPIDPEARVADLEPSAQALVAIARALAVDARLLVLDEPTASLAAGDTDLLFAAIDRMRRHGVGVLYVTHRLAEVERLADRIVVLRDGVVAGTFRVADAHEDDVVEAIVGQRVDRGTLEDPVSRGGNDRLRLSGIDGIGVGGVSLEVAAGEILALVGLMGAGQRQVGRIVAGVDRPWRGSMTLDGRPYQPRHPRDALRRGVAYLAADRLLEAGFPSLDSGTNYLARGSARTTLVRPRIDRSLVRSRLREWGVTPSAPDAPFASLSGGNQQRLLLAKWMDRRPRVFVVDEPTAGVDAAAKIAIHRRLADAARDGLSALLLSSDPDEVARVAHRALVFDHGQLVCEVGRRDLSAERIASECYRAKAPSQ